MTLVEQLPNEHEIVMKAPIQYQYAFALNRRKEEGDREHALQVLEKVRVLGECCRCVTEGCLFRSWSLQRTMYQIFWGCVGGFTRTSSQNQVTRIKIS